MSNPQHIEWLRQGVDACNARRSRDDFKPDFSEVDFREALKGSNLLDRRGIPDLKGANLGGAILWAANLGGAILWAAILREAVLEGAYLRGADVSTLVTFAAGTNNGGAAEVTDLSVTKGLTQQQLDSMKGDSGTILPDHLTRPAHWPELELGEPAPDDAPPDPTPGAKVPDPFIFLSYARQDRDRISALHEFLVTRGIPLWWDQDIPSGDEWRATIANKLKQASAVLTFWTEHSTASKAVIEEASTAQARRALVHARLDNADLPYGFAETQYDDLRDWDGTPTHPAMRKLLQKLRDVTDPPSPDAMTARLYEASPVALLPSGGKLTVRDTPANTSPAVSNQNDLDDRLEGLGGSLLNLQKKISDRQAFQLPEDLHRCLDALDSTLKFPRLTWYALEDCRHSLGDCMQEHAAAQSWNTIVYKDCDRIVGRIDELRPLMQPAQVPLDQPGAKPPETDPRIKVGQVPEVEALAQQVSDALNMPESAAVLDDTARDAFDKQIGHITDAAQPALPGPAETRRMSRLRRAVRGLAYLTGGAIATLSTGVMINLLTAPEAGVTLAARLKPIWDSILKLFL